MNALRPQMAKQITWRMLQTQRTRQARPPQEQCSQEARAQVQMCQTSQVLVQLLPELPQHPTCQCSFSNNSSGPQDNIRGLRVQGFIRCSSSCCQSSAGTTVCGMNTAVAVSGHPSTGYYTDMVLTDLRARCDEMADQLFRL